MNKYSSEIKWGIIFTIVAMGWMYFEKSMGWHGDHIDKLANYTLFFMPIAIMIYVLGIRERRHLQNGIISWKEGFISGLIITLVVALLSPISQYIVHNIISPDYLSNLIKYTVDEGFLTQEQAEVNFNLKSYMSQAFIRALGSGAFTSAIVSLILMRRT